MARRKIQYTKSATTFQQQIELLKNRGVIISDAEKAKEYLSDIGYYRLGFYLFTFESTYPETGNRRIHNVIPNTRIEDAVAYYYYNMDEAQAPTGTIKKIKLRLRAVGAVCIRIYPILRKSRHFVSTIIRKLCQEKYAARGFFPFLLCNDRDFL
ncbi:hypothetical protein E5358_11105 [Palleniella muris]|uniref:Uncharacterized protein n=1 Tax=Palleniella muris TaxID=3038145 RepID=A0AC61QNB4_9BACT|nr:hypothetical protein [Palleniella muris]TGX81159.1 hypothetical protein E5358_11105 [Palleniella muris]